MKVFHSSVDRRWAGAGRLVLPIVAALFLVAAVIGVSRIALAAGSDSFAGAIVITQASLPYSDTTDTTTATTEPGEDSSYCVYPNNTVWYSFTPTVSDSYRFDTAGSDHNTVLTIYTGSGLGNLNTWSCNYGSFDSSFTSFLDAGTTYYIQLGSYDPGGGTVANLNIAQLGHVGDFVWQDRNQNGVQDSGEPGINNGCVNAYDLSDNYVDGYCFDDDGYYELNLAPGTYYLQFSPGFGNYTWTNRDVGGDGLDSDVDSTGRVTITISSGDVISNVDAGLVTNSIGNFQWQDNDADGVQDVGEPGIDQCLDLYDGSNSYITSDCANDSGIYRFFGLTPGDYVVQFYTPCCGGWSFSPQDQGGNDNLDSDAHVMTGRTITFTVASATSNDDSRDVGLIPPAFVGNRVWQDDNGNGIQDFGEAGLEDIQVDLYDSGDNYISTNYSNESGNYLFEVPPGSYYLIFSDTDGVYMLTQQDQGGNDNVDSDADPLTGETAVFTVAPDETISNLDAGFLPTGVGDRIWEDTDGDGVQDGGEPGLADVYIELYDEFNNFYDSTYSDADGNYNIPAAPGDYVLYFYTPCCGYSFSPQDQGGNDTLDSDPDPATGRTITFTVTAGQVVTTWDAGFAPPVTIGDFVWYDYDGDGIQDAGEPGAPLLEVDLFGESGFYGSTLTDLAGYYEFEVAPGDYSVQFITPGNFGYSPQDQGGNDDLDSDADPGTGRTITFTAVTNAPQLHWDAGLATTGVGDYVWRDSNLNGIQDAGEPGIPGVQVNLYDVNGLTDTALTDFNGIYTFAGKAAGDYSVEFILPPGNLFTLQDQGGDDALDSDPNPATGRTVTFTLSTGEFDPTWDAGMTKLPFIVNNNEDASDIAVGDTICLDGSVQTPPEGMCSLRAALDEANYNLDPDVILFDPVVFGIAQTIVLTQEEYNIGTPVVISGTGPSLLTIDAIGGSRHFIIAYIGCVAEACAPAIEGGFLGIPVVGISGVRLVNGVADGDDCLPFCEPIREMMGAGTAESPEGLIVNGGGSIFAFVVSLDLSDVEFDNNSAYYLEPAKSGDEPSEVAQASGSGKGPGEGISANLTGLGGAVMSFFAEVTMDNVEADDNYADQGGGAIFSLGILTMTNSELDENSAFMGGGLFNIGPAAIIDSEIDDNDSYIGGGIMNGIPLFAFCPPYCICPPNCASEGSIPFELSLDLVISNTVIEQNEAFLGGGLATNFGRVIVNNSQVLDNNAGQGGGLAQIPFNIPEVEGIAGPFVQELIVRDSLVAGNDASDDICLSEGNCRAAEGCQVVEGGCGTPAGGGIYQGTAGFFCATEGGCCLTEGGCQGIEAGPPSSYDMTLTVENSVIRDNRVDPFSCQSQAEGCPGAEGLSDFGGGGGIYSDFGIVTVTASEIYSNSAGSDACLPLVEGCQAIEGGGGDSGGGIAVFLSELTVVSSHIYSNTASSEGGGILAQGSQLVITGTTIAGNVIGNDGGGIELDEYFLLGPEGGEEAGCVAEISHSAIISNTIFDNGGGLDLESSGCEVTVRNTTISGNSASGPGGGVYNGGGFLLMENVTIANNQGQTESCGNQAAEQIQGCRAAEMGQGVFGGGGGLYVVGSQCCLEGGGGGGVTQLRNVLIGDNSTPFGLGPDCRTEEGAVVNTYGYNLIEDTTDCVIEGDSSTDLYGMDPGLEPVADNGGATPTQALEPNSPALNAGLCSLPNDQRGVSRPQGSGCEMGAYESELEGGADVALLGFGANGNTTISVTYVITGTSVPSFTLSFYRSLTDTAYQPVDTHLSTVNVTNPADLTVGQHQVFFTLGAGAELVNNANEINYDYYILAVADVADSVTESDADPHNEDNTVPFAGVYHKNNAYIFVHGRDVPTDTIDIARTAANTRVIFNGVTYSNPSSGVTGYRIRAHQGDDVVNGIKFTLNLPGYIMGGPGNDNITGGSGNDVFVGGPGNDHIRGLDTTDKAAYLDSPAAVTADIALGGASADGWGTADTFQTIHNLEGSEFNDTLSGNSQANFIHGHGGMDTINGRDGYDTLYGGAGNDTINGGNQDDSITAGDGDDIVDAGAGNDTVAGENGNDTIYGGANNDSLLGHGGNDLIYGGPGADDLYGGSELGVDNNDTLYGEAGTDIIYGGSYDDFIAGGAGADTLYGGDGNDTLHANTITCTNDGSADTLNGGTQTTADTATYTPAQDTIAAIESSTSCLVQIGIGSINNRR